MAQRHRVNLLAHLPAVAVRRDLLVLWPYLDLQLVEYGKRV
jgi:hypothetical protein